MVDAFVDLDTFAAYFLGFFVMISSLYIAPKQANPKIYPSHSASASSEWKPRALSFSGLGP